MISFLIAGAQVILFYLLPMLIGRVIVRRLYANTIPYPFVSYFITGAFTIFATVLLARYTVGILFPNIPFEHIFAGIVSLLTLASIPANIADSRSDLSVKKYLAPFGFSTVLAGIVLALWNIRSPYPFNWDMLEHQTLVDTILDGRFSYVTSQVTDTFGFNGYSSFLHTLIAASQWMYQVPIFEYWHAIGALHLVLVTFVSYLLAKEITEHKAIAYLSAVLGAFVFDSSVSFTSLFFIPQTFTAVVTMFALTQLFASIKQGVMPSFKTIGFNSLFIFLNHYVIGTIAVGLYGATYLYSRYRTWIATHFNRVFLFALGVILAATAVIVSAYIPLDSLNSGEAAAFNPNFAEKFRIMRQIYGYALAIFLPIGIATILKVRGEVEVLILAITLALFAMVLLQFPYVMKFYVLGRFFVHIVMAIGMYAVIRLVSSQLLRSAAYMLIGITFLSLFITNSASWKEILRYRDSYTNISPQEVEAAEFLRASYGSRDALVISDPATQQVLEAVSGVNSQGGAYMNVTSRNLLHTALFAENQADAARAIHAIQDTVEPTSGTRLLALSGRYFVWQYSNLADKQALSFNIWYPSDLTLENQRYIAYLTENSEYFEVVYANPTVVILEVKKPN